MKLQSKLSYSNDKNLLPTYPSVKLSNVIINKNIILSVKQKLLNFT